MDRSVARNLWQLLEPYHSVVYFSPENREIYAAAGLKGGWMGYFASRAAAMGPVPPEVVIATFYNFHPNMVRRAIPDAWSFSSPGAVLKARREVADTALRRLLGDQIAGDGVAEAASIARDVALRCDPAGRPLFAAHASLTWPGEPHLILWHAATLLREHRGDAHVALLLANGITGCEAHVLTCAAGGLPAAVQRSFRGWSEQEWADAEQALRDRDFIDDQANLTEAGMRFRVSIEDATDDLALPPYAAIGEQACARLVELLIPLVRRIVGKGSFPYPNPIGLPKAAALT